MVEQGQGPPPFEEALGGQVEARLAAETRFRHQNVNRDQGPAAAAFDGPLPVVVPGQVVGAAGHQERTKPSPLRLQAAEVFAFPQPGKEPLDEVSRGLGVVPLAPDEGIEGIPVVAAESFQRRAGLGRVGAPAARIRPQQVVGNGAADDSSGMVSPILREADRHWCDPSGEGSPPFATPRIDIQTFLIGRRSRTGPGPASGSPGARSPADCDSAAGIPARPQPGPPRWRTSGSCFPAFVRGGPVQQSRDPVGPRGQAEQANDQALRLCQPGHHHLGLPVSDP